MSSAIASPRVAGSLELLARLRAEIAGRAGRQATAAADCWSDLPPAFKRQALQRARLDPLRECMPLTTFNPTERQALLRVALDLQRLALSLERITKG